MSKQDAASRFEFWSLDIWSLFGIWCLVLVIYNLIIQQTRVNGFETRVLLHPGLLLFLFAQGLDALGAGFDFCAVGQGDRLQVGLLFPFGGRVKLRCTQAYARPDHLAFFVTYLSNFCHIDIGVRVT